VGLTGYQADDWLRDERHIDVEHADHRRIMPLVTFAHGPEEIDRLVRALRDLVDERGRPGADTDVPPMPSRSELRTEQAVLPRDAFFATAETVDADKAAGRVSAELITPYPPGIPVIAPGEVINKAALHYLTELMEANGFVEGAADPSLATMRVTAR
jgi:arginine/lysine/ornithine decarboxylase